MRFYTANERAEIFLDTDRFAKQNEQAQIKLNMMVVADSTPLVPFKQGNLRSNVRYPNGVAGDVIEWATPYAHYQYEGELYLTESGSSYAKAGEIKYPVERALVYHGGGGSHWFEEAKAQNGNKWIKTTKRIAGGG